MLTIKRLVFDIEHAIYRVTPGRCLLLRDVSQTGDAAYLPANHRAGTMRSSSDYAETRECRALPVCACLYRSQTSSTFSASLLVQANARYAMADFGRRATHVTQDFKRNSRPPFAHLLWPNRCPSAATDSDVGESVDRFLPRR